MKDYKSILAEIKANTDEAARLDAEADALYKKQEIQTAAARHEYHAIKELRNSITEQDEQTAAELYTRAAELRSINKIFAENARASFAEYSKPIISGIMQKYNGKQYGEKTREKIRNEAHAAGIGFYFTGYGEQDTVVIYALTDAGYTDHAMKDIHIYATDGNGHRAAFISESNKISDISTIVYSHHYKYTEAPADRRAEIEEAYKKYCEAYEAAKAAQAALNALLPDTAKRYDAVGHLSPHQKF